LQKAKEVLDIMNLGEQERRAYEWHMEELSYQASMYQSSYHDGRLDGEKKGMEKGRAEGREEGREEGLKEKAMAKALKQEGVDLAVIARTSGLSIEGSG